MTTDTYEQQPSGAPPRQLIHHSQFPFAPAVKSQTFGRIALSGPSGSGKTPVALKIAAALGGRIGMIETAHGQAAQYADEVDFEVCPPLTFCSPEVLVAALADCAARGYATVVIDSFSLFWSGNGGVRDQADDASQSAGDSKAGWREVRPRERRMMDALFNYPGHVIVTLRSKTHYLPETDEQGRNFVRRLGGKPEARDGIEYEFQITAALEADHTLVVTKALGTALASATVHRSGEEFGDKIRAWLEAGAPMTPPEPVEALILRVMSPDISFEELGAVRETVRRRYLEDLQVPGDDGQPVPINTYINNRGRVMQQQAAQDAHATTSA
ncbi:AAA family ATPase [Streptomyces sp. NPDC086796]|uniref:AAA family ATPase n=1 Tax=Streptomyces sp. NPDC086796 TaxID=3365760 RepID=UPI0038223EA9